MFMPRCLLTGCFRSVSLPPNLRLPFGAGQRNSVARRFSMSRRSLASLCVLGAAIVFLWVTPVPVASQAPPATKPNPGASLRTPWGEPDLQGIWNIDADVPLERAPEYAGREFLTETEIAALDAKKAEDPGRNARAEEGTDRDVGGAYNAVFNSVLRTGKRTSMVIDPPDGRIPPLTPEGERQ